MPGHDGKPILVTIQRPKKAEGEKRPPPQKKPEGDKKPPPQKTPKAPKPEE